MARVFILCSVLAFSSVFYTNGQNECTNPPPMFAHSGCCQPATWSDTDAAAKCNQADNIFCFTECIFNVTEIVPNGQIDSANLKSLFEDELKSDTDYIQAAIKSFEKCYSLVQEKMASRRMQVGGCSSLPVSIIECVNTQMFVNCPANKWRGSEHCEKVKAFYEKCPLRNYAIKN